jgi:hypothetical protein
MARNRIRKGISVPAWVKADKGFHEGIHFCYKPMLPEECGDLSERLEKQRFLSGSVSTRLLSEEIAKRITWWDEIEDNGELCPVSSTALSEMPYSLWNSIVSIVRGMAPSDFPDAGTDEEKEWVRLQERAASLSQSPGAAIVDAVKGN